MKKTYISPQTYTIEVEIETLIATSGEATIDYSNDLKADENYEVLSNKQRPGSIWDNLWGE